MAKVGMSFDRQACYKFYATALLMISFDDHGDKPVVKAEFQLHPCTLAPKVVVETHPPERAQKRST
eukprot:3594421-Amphidinium_carterae.1